MRWKKENILEILCEDDVSILLYNCYPKSILYEDALETGEVRFDLVYD